MRPLNRVACRAVILVLAVTCFEASLKSNPSEPRAQSNSTQEQSRRPQTPSSGGTIRAATNEVLVPVTVEDKRGELVLDLSQSDFHVFDNGTVQPIDHWDLGGDALAVALVVETSDHVQTILPTIRNMGGVFSQIVMGLDGQAEVITYDRSVNVALPFTTDHDAVEKSIEKLDTGGTDMRLYDGMAQAVVDLKHQPSNLHRVMLVIGESRDVGSKATLVQTLRDAVREDISIYAVGISGTSIDLRSGKQQPAVKPSKHLPELRTNPYLGTDTVDLVSPAIWLLTRGTDKISGHELGLATAATGGIHYDTLKDHTIQRVLDDIGGELHAQYLLSYRAPSGNVGEFHTIKVTVSRSALIVRARPGYYFAEGGHQQY
jgi:VWFA-related protein